MMNMFKLSEQLKDFSKDQLVREMKMPSGSVPQFLVLTELQRRTRMEREAQGGDAPEQSTVAQDAVAAAGVPQGGVAQMAQALAPKTDMAGNTGIAAMAPQAAPQRMNDGGRAGGPRTDEERFQAALRRNEYLAAEELENLQTRLADIPRYRDYEPGMDLELTGLQNVSAALARGLRRLRGDESPASMSDRASQLEYYLRTIRGMRDSLPPGDNSLTSPRGPQDVPPLPVPRMQEGGEIGDVPSIAEILAAAQENQSRAMLGPFETQYRRYLDQQVDSLPSGVEAFDPRMTPEMRRTMRAMPEVSDDPTGLDDTRPRVEEITPARPFGTYADLLDAPTTAEQVFGDLPPTRPEVSDDPTGRGERPDTSRFEAATLGLGADQEFAEPPTGRGYFPRTEDILQGIATGATFGGAALPLVNPDMAYDVGTSVFGEEPFRRAGIIDPARRRLAEQFEQEAEAADRARGPSDETRELAEQFEEEAEAADREIADLPGGVAPDLGIETPAAPTAPDGGGGGGAGGGGSRTGTLGDIDRMYEQDKWLSLARFGLGLMASSQPTLGGAIGEAGGAALDSLSQAREDLLQRRLAEAQLARRGGGGGRDSLLTPNQMLGFYSARYAEALEREGQLRDEVAMYGDEPVPGSLAAQLREAQANTAALESVFGSAFGLPLPTTPGVEPLRYDTADR